MANPFATNQNRQAPSRATFERTLRHETRPTSYTSNNEIMSVKSVYNFRNLLQKANEKTDEWK